MACSDHKLTQLLRESLGSATCNTCAIIHLSPALAAYSDTLQVMQLASRMHQTRLRRRSKVSQYVMCLLTYLFTFNSASLWYVLLITGATVLCGPRISS